MTKYRQYFNKMIKDHEVVFDKFQEIHNGYMRDRAAWQTKFNREGKQIVSIIQEYENRLCGHSEKGQFGKFSNKLAEKFQEEVKKHFPLIDFVGVTIITTKTPVSDPLANLKKITLG